MWLCRGLCRGQLILTVCWGQLFVGQTPDQVLSDSGGSSEHLAGGLAIFRFVIFRHIHRTRAASSWKISWLCRPGPTQYPNKDTKYGAAAPRTVILPGSRYYVYCSIQLYILEYA